MRLVVFYDMEGPNGSQFAVNPAEVVHLEGDDDGENSESKSSHEGVVMYLRNGRRLIAGGCLETVVRTLEGGEDARMWEGEE
jgi:hypothetical protein